MLKKATIHFYYILDESRFSDICTIMELKELNWLCKHMKNVRSSQPCISMNFFSKEQVLSCEYRWNVKCRCCPHIETNQLIGFYMRATMALNGLTYPRRRQLLYISLAKTVYTIFLFFCSMLILQWVYHVTNQSS